MSNGVLSAPAFGDTQPAAAQQIFYGRGGIPLVDAFATYGAVYRSQTWISALVNKIAYGTARLPLKVYERAEDDTRSEARDTPFAQLLRNPNPRHDPFFFWLWTVSTFEVYGEAMWVKIRPGVGRAPTQLWPLHPANVGTYRDESGTLTYRYTYGALADQALEWTADDVVHFKTYNPSDQVRGLSRLEPLRQTILNEDAARRAAQAMWSNGGRPSMMLTTPKTLSDPAYNRLEKNVKSIHQGVDNWGKIAILEEGLNPTVVPLNAEELQYIESRKISREEACGVYDIPPPVVQILDKATFSNITEQMRSLYRDTMPPRLSLFESAIDGQLRPDFDPRGVLYAEFLLDEVMRGAFEQRAVAGQAAVFSGQRTPNELRKDDNKPPLPGGDRLYINAGAIPLDDAENSAPTGTDLEESPQKVKAVVIGCAECGHAGNLSARGLCRGCEGKRARAVRKELT